MRVPGLSLLFILFLWLLPVPAVCARGFSDREVAGLMKQSNYPGAARVAIARLRALPSSAKEERMYYLSKLGFSQFRMGNFDTAYIVARQALDLARYTRDSALIADSWQLMAYASNRKGKFDSAVFFSRKLLDYAVRNNDMAKHGNALTSLSTLLMQNGRYREALKYNLEAYSIYRQLTDTALLAGSAFNIGLAYLNLKMPDSSLRYLFESLRINRKKPVPELEVFTLGIMADCYMMKGNIPLWKEYQLKANEKAEKTGNRQLVAMGFSKLSQRALAENDPGTAYSYLLKARKVLDRQPYLILQMEVDSLLYVATRKMSRHSEALKWLESYTALRKEIFNAKQEESISQMLSDLETRDKNLLILKKEMELERVKRRLTGIVLGAFTILLFAGGLAFYLVRASKFRKHLFLKNKELDQQLQLARSRLSYPAMLLGEQDIEKDNGNSQDGDAHKRSILLYSRLLDLLESEKLYLDPELNARTLQNRLGTNKKYLYEALTKFSGTNFRGLVNRYRISEVRQMMEEAVGNAGTISVNAIASASGFNSHTTFYRIFRQSTGLTPREYLIQLKKDKKKEHPFVS